VCRCAVFRLPGGSLLGLSPGNAEGGCDRPAGSHAAARPMRESIVGGWPGLPARVPCCYEAGCQAPSGRLSAAGVGGGIPSAMRALGHKVG